MDIFNIGIAVISLILGIYAIIQSSNYNKSSNEINKQTEIKLNELKSVSDNITKTADRIEQNINTQINRIINSNAPTQDEKMQQQLMSTILPELLKNPDMIEKLQKFGKQ